MKSVIENGKKSKNWNKSSIGLLLVIVAFYLFLALYYGPVLASDSKGYINMISAREPVYPLFLLVFRTLFGQIYLKVVVVVQSLLMAFAIWSLINLLDKIFELKLIHNIFMFLSFVGVAIICILFTARAVPYTNIILTEGLATSLWIFFITLLTKAIYDNSNLALAASLLVTAIMFDIRKQMAIGFIVAIAVVIISRILIRTSLVNYIKKILLVITGAGLSVVLAMLLTRAYNYSLRGEFAQNTRDMNLVLTTSLYVSDREDAELIEEAAVKSLYLKVCDALEKNECTYAYAPNNLTGLQAHYSDSFDKITLDTTANLFIEDAIERGFKEGIEAEKEADRTSGVIVSSLLADNAGKYLLVYVSSLIEGFVNTVAKRHPVLDCYAFIIYLVYIALIISNLIIYKKKNENDIYIKRVMFGLIILISIAVNVGVTGALIFCQTRYMIYNMPLFYIALIVMTPYELIKIKKLNI